MFAYSFTGRIPTPKTIHKTIKIFDKKKNIPFDLLRTLNVNRLAHDMY